MCPNVGDDDDSLTAGDAGLVGVDGRDVTEGVDPVEPDDLQLGRDLEVAVRGARRGEFVGQVAGRGGGPVAAEPDVGLDAGSGGGGDGECAGLAGGGVGQVGEWVAQDSLDSQVVELTLSSSRSRWS